MGVGCSVLVLFWSWVFGLGSLISQSGTAFILHPSSFCRLRCKLPGAPRRGSIIGNAAVLKTAARKGLQVRVLSPPPFLFLDLTVASASYSARDLDISFGFTSVTPPAATNIIGNTFALADLRSRPRHCAIERAGKTRAWDPFRSHANTRVRDTRRSG
jgi:hypothetical protein